jgi:predicted metalloprotease
MEWKGRRGSSNFEDATKTTGGGGKSIIGGGIGIVLVIIISLVTGKNPLSLMNDMGVLNGSSNTTTACTNSDSQNEEAKEFTSVILASTEEVWANIFSQMGKTYQAPRLQAFCGNTSTACGQGSAAMGPFYCPADRKVYIDLAFYRELSEKFKAPGELAMAYVIAHEVGHHVQNILGISGQVQQQISSVGEVEGNKLSVKLELQADFFAGVWAHYADKAHQMIEVGDLESALRAANAIGDDNLQKRSQGYVVPDAFTHGTSEERMYWFKKGYETGDINQGNTFQ